MRTPVSSEAVGDSENVCYGDSSALGFGSKSVGIDALPLSPSVRFGGRFGNSGKGPSTPSAGKSPAIKKTLSIASLLGPPRVAAAAMSTASASAATDLTSCMEDENPAAADNVSTASVCLHPVL